MHPISRPLFGQVPQVAQSAKPSNAGLAQSAPGDQVLFAGKKHLHEQIVEFLDAPFDSGREWPQNQQVLQKLYDLQAQHPPKKRWGRAPRLQPITNNQLYAGLGFGRVYPSGLLMFLERGSALGLLDVQPVKRKGRQQNDAEESQDVRDKIFPDSIETNVALTTLGLAFVEKTE